jgi:predicted nucleotidyltransferase
MVTNPEVLSRVVDRLVEGFHPIRIILFGSQARGMADLRSDYDFLIICDTAVGRRKLMVEMDRALSGLGIARDIVVVSAQEYERDVNIPGTIARPAHKEGVVLYERST